MGRYKLHAFAVMPNHVHLLLSPKAPLPMTNKTLKGITAERAGRMLGLKGDPFWQEENYEHPVGNPAEGERIKAYIEENPVRAGLAKLANQYRWSSAGWETSASPEARSTQANL